MTWVLPTSMVTQLREMGEIQPDKTVKKLGANEAAHRLIEAGLQIMAAQEEAKAAQNRMIKTPDELRSRSQQRRHAVQSGGVLLGGGGQ